MPDMSLDTIALRLVGAGAAANAEAEKIIGELSTANAARWPKAPIAAHATYARAKVAMAVRVAQDRWSRSGDYPN